MNWKQFWKSLGLCALYVIGYLLLQVIVTMALSFGAMLLELLRGGGDGLEAALSSMVGELSLYASIVYNLLAIGAVWGICRLQKTTMGQGLGLTPAPKSKGTESFFFGLAAGMLVVLVLNLLPLPEEALESYGEQSSFLLAGPLPLRAIAVAFLAPLAEEILFRGLIYRTLSQALSRPWAIALCALIFGLLHGHPIWIAYAALLGVLMCLVLDATGSLWCAVFFHMGVNLMGSFFMPAMPWAYSGVFLALSLVVSLLLAKRLGIGKRQTA